LTQNEAGTPVPPPSERIGPAEPSAHPDAGPAAWPQVERRRQPDRRLAPTPFWSAFVGRRRRRHGRRAGERDDIYVDRFTRRDVVLVVAILLLNIFDAFFTLIWLQRGGAEGNPLMAWLLEHGNGPFLVQKCIVVGLWLLLLVVHKNFRVARLGLYSLAAIYSLLILYHFALMASGVDPRHGPGRRAGLASEQTGEERRHDGLHPQRALAEADRPQTGGPEPLDLVIAPAPLRTDRE
jgi:hypothetical protein